jgi:hypothetical protein
MAKTGNIWTCQGRRPCHRTKMMVMAFLDFKEKVYSSYVSKYETANARYEA